MPAEKELSKNEAKDQRSEHTGIVVDFAVVNLDLDSGAVTELTPEAEDKIPRTRSQLSK